MDIHERNIVALGHDIERGLEQDIIELPSFRTVESQLRPGTRCVAALDGSDQQIFSTAADPDLGVAAWATLYVEFDPNRPDEECYREGPGSAGAWSQDELLSYHLTVELPNQDVTREFGNDLFAARQILSSTRVTEPPLFSPRTPGQGVRREAARERATGEWLALRAAITMQLPPHGLLLKDGRFNCQIEQEAAWVDQMGRIAARNGVQALALVKAGSLYRAAYPIVRAIAHQTGRPFYFVASPLLIERAFANDTYRCARR